MAGHDFDLSRRTRTCLGNHRLDTGKAELRPIRLHHLAEADGNALKCRLLVDSCSARQQCPTPGLALRVLDRAGGRACYPLLPRQFTLRTFQPLVEIVALETDQRLLPALHDGEHLPGALHFSHSLKCGRLDLQASGLVLDRVERLTVKQLEKSSISAAPMGTVLMERIRVAGS